MGFRVSKNQFIKLLQIEKQLGTLAALEVFKDGFQYGDSAVVRAKGSDDIEIVNMHWEFIPWWIKNMDELKAARKQGIPWLNATSERLLQSKMYRDAALKRRCLVPATHFYEWRHFKPEGEKKAIAYPYCVQLKEGKPFFIAGIWQPWTDKETGETMDTFAIITTKANALMDKVHNTKKRMPVILTEELAHEWIFSNLDEKRIQEIASFQLPASEMEAFSIRKDFKVIPDPLETYSYAELPEL
jgi:putative SOS response-associated peptidase YedK